jgi:translation initiation factor eIF-2B subunit alpha/methylthioribose-1-phosphate isomerase
MKVLFQGKTKDMRAVWWDDGVRMIDQRRIPEKVEIFRADDMDSLTFAIKDMVVRGAPAIGVAAAYGMALAWTNRSDMGSASSAIRATRPTAQDLFHAVRSMEMAWIDGKDVVSASEGYADGIVEMCRLIGENGVRLIKKGCRILTHCNAGALATVDHGTALAPIRVAKRKGLEPFVYVDETRPRLQGSRLTSWELLNEGIEHRVIADNAAGYYMLQGKVDLVLVGADRITADGDIANKVGTYEKAVLAKENGVPFYVAAPASTFDPSIKTWEQIVIEERSEDEVLMIGKERIASKGARALNPAFDVTPGRYITGYITEHGIFERAEVKKMTSKWCAMRQP